MFVTGEILGERHLVLNCVSLNTTTSIVHFKLHCIHAYSQTKVEFLAKGSLLDNSGFKIVAIGIRHYPICVILTNMKHHGRCICLRSVKSCTHDLLLYDPKDKEWVRCFKKSKSNIILTLVTLWWTLSRCCYCPTTSCDSNLAPLPDDASLQTLE